MAPLAAIKGESIMTQPFPVPDDKKINQQAIDEIKWVTQFILGVRQIRSGQNIDPRKSMVVLVTNGSDEDKHRLEKNKHYLTAVGRIESISWLASEANAPESATALVGNMKLLIPMAGLINKDEEIIRLSKEINKKLDEETRLGNKLGNENFIQRAPAFVIEKERIKLDEIQSSLGQLREQLEKIEQL